jgi:hypothetical protein
MCKGFSENDEKSEGLLSVLYVQSALQTGFCLSYFNDNASAPEKTPELQFKNVKNTGNIRL